MRTEGLRERRLLERGADVGIVTGLNVENGPSVSELVLVGNRCSCSEVGTDSGSLVDRGEGQWGG